MNIVSENKTPEINYEIAELKSKDLDATADYSQYVSGAIKFVEDEGGLNHVQSVEAAKEITDAANRWLKSNKSSLIDIVFISENIKVIKRNQISPELYSMFDGISEFPSKPFVFPNNLPVAGGGEG